MTTPRGEENIYLCSIFSAVFFFRGDPSLDLPPIPHIRYILFLMSRNNLKKAYGKYLEMAISSGIIGLTLSGIIASVLMGLFLSTTHQHDNNAVFLENPFLKFISLPTNTNYRSDNENSNSGSAHFEEDHLHLITKPFFLLLLSLQLVVLISNGVSTGYLDYLKATDYKAFYENEKRREMWYVSISISLVIYFYISSVFILPSIEIEYLFPKGLS